MGRRGKYRCMVAIVACIVLSVSGCGQAASPGEDKTTEDAAFFFAHLRARQENVKAVYYDLSFAERLPNVLFSIRGAEPRPLGSGIVVGKVTDVQPGRGYRADEGDVGGEEVPFNSPQAMWRTISLTVVLSDQGWGYDGEQVSIGLAISADIDQGRMMQGARELGQIIVAPDPQGFFDHDKTLYQVARNESLIGQVHSDQSLDFPALGGYEATYFGEIHDLQSVQLSAERPVKTIEVPGAVRTR